MVLLDVDPEYFPRADDYLPRARKILERQKLTWPNAIAPKGFQDTVRVFNLSGYGNIVVDAKGVVRGVNVHGKELERLLEEVVAGKKADQPRR